MGTLDKLFESNKAWAKKTLETDPSFFDNLSEQQNPEYLWIGCSDSRVPANQIMTLPPGEVFVHRNIANIVAPTDLNCLSVIQYAVEVLEVKHIIVCGHYGCGGVHSAINNNEQRLADNWLQEIRNINAEYEMQLDKLEENQRMNKLCELNVISQVKNVVNTTILQKAWIDNKDITVHGLIYDIHNGILKDLKTSLNLSKK